MPREKIKNTMRSAEEKEKLVLEYKESNMGFRRFAENYDIHPFTFHKWIKKYEEKGISGLKSQTGKKTGETKGQGAKKPKNEEERLKREITKLEIELARLKKGYQVKGVGVKREYVTTFEENTK